VLTRFFFIEKYCEKYIAITGDSLFVNRLLSENKMDFNNTDELLGEYDIISARHDYLTGCFALYRNNDMIQELFA
jgi:hypothetical protein